MKSIWGRRSSLWSWQSSSFSAMSSAACRSLLFNSGPTGTLMHIRALIGQVSRIPHPSSILTPLSNVRRRSIIDTVKRTCSFHALYYYLADEEVPGFVERIISARRLDHSSQVGARSIQKVWKRSFDMLYDGQNVILDAGVILVTKDEEYPFCAIGAGQNNPPLRPFTVWILAALPYLYAWNVFSSRGNNIRNT